MLRKLAPTSIAAAEINGLTIYSFLGERSKKSQKEADANIQTRRYEAGKRMASCEIDS